MGEKDHSDHQLAGDAGLRFAPLEEIHRVRGSIADPLARAAITGDICRLNTLYMIMNAGSGHIGSSFSSTDIITWLWTEELRDPNGPAQGSDVYFSSKGHDAPALYALLIALGKLDASLLHRLRRFGGLPGHPDVETPYIAANTGSLGMGISKAYGMARAHRYLGTGGRIVVMTGDGELQEGQIWESLQPAANERLAEITVVVDHNKFQSDSAVAAVSDLGPMRAAWRADLVDLGLTDRRSGWPLEMVLRAGAAGWRIAELPVRYRPRQGRSKVTGTVRGTLTAVQDMRSQLQHLAPTAS